MKMNPYLSLFFKLLISALLVIIPIYFWPHKFMEVVTLLAVLVALFREKILAFFLPPVLEISIAEPPNYFAEVPATDKKGNAVGYHAVIGVLVENKGMSNAQNVRVLFNGIKSSIIPNLKRYQSLPFVISWFSPETTIKSLPPNTPVRFSVGYSPDYDPDIFDFEFVQKPNELSQINCPPNQTTTFRFEAKAISDNSKPVSAVIKIEFKGTYKAGLNVKLSRK
jgi:hypothetical protein